MNSLDLSLILLVALALACVIVYNLWSGRRRRARMAGSPKPRTEPARSDPAGAAGSARSEPSLQLDGASASGDGGPVSAELSPTGAGLVLSGALR